jgi:hypothetical protein
MFQPSTYIPDRRHREGPSRLLNSSWTIDLLFPSRYGTDTDRLPARILPGEVVRLFDATPSRPARPDCAKHMDDSVERHYTEEWHPAQRVSRI